MVGLGDLPDRIVSGTSPLPAVEVGRPVTLRELEAAHVRRVLTSVGDIDEASRILGIDPSTLYRKRKQLGI